MIELDESLLPARVAEVNMHQQPGTDDVQKTQSQDSAPRRKKRVITAARQEQNRLAQRAFRQRKKEQRQEAKAMAGSGGTTSKPLQRKPVSDTLVGDGELGEAAFPAEDILLNPNVRRMDATELDTSPYSYSSLTDSSSSSVIPDADLAFSSPDSGISGSPEETGSTTRNVCRQVSPWSRRYAAADPLANTLEFKESTILAAMIHNGAAMGFNLDDVASCNTDMMSPLYTPATPASDPMALLASIRGGGHGGSIPPDLRPTLNQVLIPHHVSLDLIPFPALRDRLIVLSAAMPDTFNMWELKVDLYERGGLSIVKSNRDGPPGSNRGAFQPWDRRCWVATPWFLNKWRMLVGEEEREQLEGGGVLRHSSPSRPT